MNKPSNPVAGHTPGEWPKIEAIDGVGRCYFGPFDLVGMSCQEFASAPRFARENEVLREALERLVAVCDAYDNGMYFSRAIVAAKDEAKTALTASSRPVAASEPDKQEKVP